MLDPFGSVCVVDSGEQTTKRKTGKLLVQTKISGILTIPLLVVDKSQGRTPTGTDAGVLTNRTCWFRVRLTSFVSLTALADDQQS